MPLSEIRAVDWRDKFCVEEFDDDDEDEEDEGDVDTGHIDDLFLLFVLLEFIIEFVQLLLLPLFC